MRRIPESVSQATAWGSRCSTIANRERALTHAMLVALARWDRKKASDYFELVSHWNELHQIATECADASGEQDVATYAADSWFLHELSDVLTATRNEDLRYITGVELSGIRILSRMCAVAFKVQTPTWLEGNAESCSDALIEMWEYGNRPHAVAHSHPGRGVAATHPSTTDLTYLRNEQKTGSRMIGIIFSRDGYIRFYSASASFRVVIHGKGVQQVEKAVYRLTQLPAGGDTQIACR